jgi:hypothetical protein
MTTEVKKIELTDEQKESREAFRKANLFIKGILCGYAKKHGMKHESTKAPCEAFKAGWEFGSGWLDRTQITAWHILYNQLKGKKSHTGDVKKDAKFEYDRLQAEMKIEAFAGRCFEMLEVRHG